MDKTDAMTTEHIPLTAVDPKSRGLSDSLRNKPTHDVTNKDTKSSPCKIQNETGVSGRAPSIGSSDSSGNYSDMFDHMPDLKEINRHSRGQELDQPDRRPGHSVKPMEHQNSRRNWSLGQQSDFSFLQNDNQCSRPDLQACKSSSLGSRPPYALNTSWKRGGDSRSSTMDSTSKRSSDVRQPLVDRLAYRSGDPRYDSLGHRSADLRYLSLAGRSFDELSSVCSCGHPMNATELPGSQSRVDEDFRSRMHSMARQSVCSFLSHVSHSSRLPNGGRPLTPAEELDIIRKQSRKRKFTIIGVCITIAIVIALLVGILARIQGTEKQVRVLPDVRQTTLYSTNYLLGSVKIVGGPLHDIETTGSEASFAQGAFIFQMEHLLRKTPYGKMLEKIKNTQLGSESKWQFEVKLRETIEVTGSTNDDVTEALRQAIGPDGTVGILVIDPISVRLEAVKLTSTNPTKATVQCEPMIDWLPCRDIPGIHYTEIAFPTVFGHSLHQALTEGSMFYINLTSSGCYDFIQSYWCAVFVPKCGSNGIVTACRQFCQGARDSCAHTIPKAHQWIFDCDVFMDSEDPDVCIQDPSHKKTRCEKTHFPLCQPPGGSGLARYPNLLGHTTSARARQYLNQVRELSKTFRCHPSAHLLGCSLLSPSCSAKDDVNSPIVPPCRSLCEDVLYKCGFFVDLLGATWMRQLNCSAFPEWSNETQCIGDVEAVDAHLTVCGETELTCDRGRCIPADWVCDGRVDCQDKTDEAHCAQCENDEYRCTNGLCIEAVEQCDGMAQCLHGEDEHGCTRLDGHGSSGYLVQYHSVTRTWEPVCLEYVNQSYGRAVCKHHGFRDLRDLEEPSITVAATDVAENQKPSSALKKINETLAKRCANGRPVFLNCQPEECGIRTGPLPFAGAPSVGAEENPGVWPWVVSLHGGPSQNFYCGGALVSADWVLTAAHCIGRKVNGKELTIKIGNTRLYTSTPGEQVRGVRRVVKHPSYNAINFDVDLGLLQLDRPIKLMDTARPVCLPANNTDIPVGATCYTAGWGKISDGAEEYSRVAHSREVRIVNRTQCGQAIRAADPNSPYEVTGNTICAEGSLLSDACHGDSGCIMACEGPSARWYAAGVVSWGLGCGRAALPGVYAAVSPFVDWINRVIEET